MSISPQGYNMGNKPTNENPFWGEGETDNVERIYATATETENGGSIAVTVTKRISGNNIYFDFNFQNTKGNPGQPGNDGFSPTVAITPTVDGNIIRITDATGSHSFDVKNGTDGRNGTGITNIEYDHEDLDGNKVYRVTMTDSTIYFITAPKGDPGAKGDTGETPNVTATATVDGTTGTPSVNVTKTGTAENPVLNFSFTGLKGAQGDPGSGGSTVQCFPAGSIGTLIGTIIIDGTSYDLYAPGGSTVTVTPVQTTGTKIATISIDGVGTDLYAPSGGGGSTVQCYPAGTLGTLIGTFIIDGTSYDLYAPGGSVVTVTPVQTTGTKIATISIDGVNTDLYAPSGGSSVNITNTSNTIPGNTSMSFSAYERQTVSFRFNGGSSDTVIIKGVMWNNPPSSPVIIESAWANYSDYYNAWVINVRLANTSNATASWPVDDFMQIACDVIVDYCVITQ